MSVCTRLTKKTPASITPTQGYRNGPGILLITKVLTCRALVVSLNLGWKGGHLYSRTVQKTRGSDEQAPFLMINYPIRVSRGFWSVAVVATVPRLQCLSFLLCCMSLTFCQVQSCEQINLIIFDIVYTPWMRENGLSYTTIFKSETD